MSLATEVANLGKKLSEHIGVVKGQFSKWDGQVKAQIKKLVDWQNKARIRFVGSDIIPTKFTNYFSVGSSYGNTGEITSEVGVLVHDINADGYTAKQSDFSVGGEIKETLPKHPLARDKRATYDVAMVDIKNPDSERNFYLYVDVVNQAIFSEGEELNSNGSVWVYFSRDVNINLIFVCSVEYPFRSEIFIDGEKFNGSISRGWHKLTVYNDGAKVAWSKMDILRFNLASNDNLSDLKLAVTHVSSLVNNQLSAVLKKVEA